ncbi:helix-turn-helix domain-containing protein [Chengkuizengella axinellae]
MYEISDASVLRSWIKQYENCGDEALKDKHGK